MTIHDTLFSSQDPLSKTASIHDTPPVEDAPDPIAINHVSLHDIRELESDKVYEPAPKIRFSASIKDDLDIPELVNTVFEEQKTAIDKRVRKLCGKANKSKQQRRRDAQKAKQTQIKTSKTNKSYKKSYKKNKKTPWTAKPLPTAWKDLAKLKGWKDLDRREQEQLKMFYPHYHATLSATEIGDLLDITRDSAFSRIRTWCDNDQIKKRHEYLPKRTGPGKRNGELTSIHRRNHYQVNKQRKEELIAIAKKLKADERNIFDARKDFFFEKGFCQADFINPAHSKNGKNLQWKLEELTEVRLSKERQVIFELYNLHTRAEREFSRTFKAKVNETPLKILNKFLKWIAKKLRKGYRIIHFGKFFNWLLKHKEKPMSWFKKRTKAYFVAIQTKTALGGVDSDAVIEQILDLQKQTGLKINEQDLHGVLRYGAQHLRVALKFTLFRAKRVMPQHWIKFLYFVLRKSIMEISKMYKSEEKIRHERKAYDKEIQQQEQ